MAVAVQTFHSQSKAGSRRQKLFPFKCVSFIWGKKVFLESPSHISSHISLEGTGSQAWETWQRGMGLAVPGWGTLSPLKKSCLF